MRFAAGLGLAIMLMGIVPAEAAANTSSGRVIDNITGDTSFADVSTTQELTGVLFQRVKDALKEGQAVPVVIKTLVPWAPERLLGDWEKTVQRRQIQEAAAMLRKSLPTLRDWSPLSDKPYVQALISSSDLPALEAAKGIASIALADDFNWRRDFVDLRIAARLSATPVEKATAKLPTPRIVGGYKAEPDVHPFQVALLEKENPDNFWAQFCGGSLLGDRYVITAAHCSDSITDPSSEVQVLVGTQALDGSGQRIDVSRVAYHPSFDSYTVDYDIAVWTLATPVTGIPSARLATSQPTTAGTPLRVTGWGYTIPGDDDSWPVDLQQVDVPYVPTTLRSCEYQTGVTPRMLCAGSTGKDSCQGDSGGPLTMNAGEGYVDLVGVVSYGAGCGDQNYPGVYTNLANATIRNFIDRQTASGIRYKKIGPGSGSVSFTPAGTGTSCVRNCYNAYSSGTVVTLEARPASGSRFLGWKGACSGTGSCRVTVSGITKVSARFR